ncbi:hypothetical protein Bca52824_034468 [Brassica carinata]|uniref:Uncharacterized protein n=1 Tax=Brassica carinata TaxID=52824 RepID=A0A8X7V379_BRACI|nr:hypothetical protein Bca52824_034468 [Brassica carinata]
MKSISDHTDNSKLFAALSEGLRADEYEELKESKLGVFIKFKELNFNWASRLLSSLRHTCSDVIYAASLKCLIDDLKRKRPMEEDYAKPRRGLRQGEAAATNGTGRSSAVRDEQTATAKRTLPSRTQLSPIRSLCSRRCSTRGPV